MRFATGIRFAAVLALVLGFALTGNNKTAAEHVPITIHAMDGEFSVVGATDLELNDEVKFVVTGEGGIHGIRVFSPNGSVLFTLEPLGSNPSERTVVLSATGTYDFICTRPTCSGGHSDMFGSFSVGPDTGPGPGDRY